MHVPRTVDSISPDWLTEILRSGASVASARVQSFEAEPVGEGQGLTAPLARLRISYDKPETHSPDSVVAKLTPPNLVAPTAPWAKRTSLYEREYRYYTELAARSGMPSPMTFGAALESESGAAALLLEDLGHLRPGDQVAGCTEDDARLALGYLAVMHSRWWNRPELDELGWLVTDEPVEESVSLALGSWPQLWSRFTSNYAQHISPGLRQIGEAYGGSIRSVYALRSTRPVTLTHGDFRLGNMFFDHGKDRDFVIADWQLVSKYPPGMDVGYFLAWSIPDGSDPGMSHRLAEHYYGSLLANGVTEYDHQRFVMECRLGMVRALSVGAFALAIEGASDHVLDTVGPAIIRRMKIPE